MRRRGFLVALGGVVAECAAPLRAFAAAVSPPTSVRVTDVAATTITIAWESTSVFFTTWLDAAQVGRVKAKAYTFVGLEPDTAYRCGVAAVKGPNRSGVVYVDAATTKNAPTGSGAMSIGAYQ